MKIIRLVFVLIISIIFKFNSTAQTCTTFGQTPATALPVCALVPYSQVQVPVCNNGVVQVPVCSVTGSPPTVYEAKNPFWYKFTCYQAGTLDFVITPNTGGQDYDWQLYDVTTVTNLNTIFATTAFVVTGNWSGTTGLTGASGTGVILGSNGGVNGCSSDPANNTNPFAFHPTLIVGHKYLLMVSHYDNDNQTGYSLSFGGGTASITDPLQPH
jgi:hypothetical protein